MFFEDYLKAAKCRYKPDTIKTITSRLIGQVAPMNWTVAFNTIGIYTTEMNVCDLAAAKTLIKNVCRKTGTYFALDAALNVAFSWGIEKDYIQFTRELL